MYIYRLGRIRENFVVWEFQSILESSRRPRLYGWRFCTLFCDEYDFGPTLMVSLRVPGPTVCHS
jgi:hypothetical protein